MLDDIVGSYRLGSKLGEGGMGMVYSATHTVLGKLAAVKLMRPHLCADEESVARFFNEAVLTAAIRHPGIVEIFDYGIHEPSGSAFITMALLEGESLETRLGRRRRLGLIESLRIGQQIASALAAAHAAGVVHRDLKPDNVFLTPDPDLPGGERIQLLDFGIAKLLDEKEQAIGLTQTGTIIGTPLYMSPEQCKGRADLDGRTDLYALGCMLYRMLSGAPPFTGATPLEVAASHLRDAPVPLRERVPDLSRPISDLVSELLAKDRDERPESAAALHRRLGELLSTVDTVRDRPEPRGDAGFDLGNAATIATGNAAFARSRRLGRIILALVALAGVGGGLAALRSSRQPPAALAIAVELPRDCGGLAPQPCRRAAWALAYNEAGIVDRDRAAAMLADACAAGSFEACADAVAVDRRLLIPRSEPHLGDPSAPHVAHLVVDFADPDTPQNIQRLWQRLRDRFPGKLSLTAIGGGRGALSFDAARAACAAHRQRAFGDVIDRLSVFPDAAWTAQRIRAFNWSTLGFDRERGAADFEGACASEAERFRAALADLALEPGTLIVDGHVVGPAHDLDLVAYVIDRHLAEVNGPRETRLAAARRLIQSTVRYPIAATGPPAAVTLVTACDPARTSCVVVDVLARAQSRMIGARVNQLLIAAEPDNSLAARTLCAAQRVDLGPAVSELLAGALGKPLPARAIRAAVTGAGVSWSAFTARRDRECAAEVAAATRKIIDAGAPTTVPIFVNGRPSRTIGTPTQALVNEELQLADLYGYDRRIPAARYYDWLVRDAPRRPAPAH